MLDVMQREEAAAVVSIDTILEVVNFGAEIPERVKL